MTGWAELAAELDAWARAGRAATFWWRDDDATAPSPALDRLLRLRQEVAVPLALAVIPAGATPALRQRLGDEAPDTVAVLQHGFAHANHAPPGAKKCELCGDRPLAAVAAELRRGFALLEGWPGFAPVLVPPWNRLADGLPPLLPALGFKGLSRFGARPRAGTPPGLALADTHLDPVAWRKGRGFVGRDTALGAALDHLRARREGAADRAEPTGLLTHHAAHDENTNDFIAEFLARVAAHPGARWLRVEEAFAWTGPPT